jgi:hypothetical protein
MRSRDPDLNGFLLPDEYIVLDRIWKGPSSPLVVPNRYIDILTNSCGWRTRGALLGLCRLFLHSNPRGAAKREAYVSADRQERRQSIPCRCSQILQRSVSRSPLYLGRNRHRQGYNTAGSINGARRGELRNRRRPRGDDSEVPE